MQIASKTKVVTVVLVGVVLFVAGIILGKYFFKQLPLSNPSPEALASAFRQGGGKYTNPLLECDQSQTEFVELKPFKSKINDEVSALGLVRVFGNCFGGAGDHAAGANATF